MLVAIPSTRIEVLTDIILFAFVFDRWKWRACGYECFAICPIKEILRLCLVQSRWI